MPKVTHGWQQAVSKLGGRGPMIRTSMRPWYHGNLRRPTTWMSRTGSERINGDRINGLFHLIINGVYWGDNPLTNHLLTSWEIQAPMQCHPRCRKNRVSNPYLGVKKNIIFHQPLCWGYVNATWVWNIYATWVVYIYIYIYMLPLLFKNLTLVLILAIIGILNHIPIT